MKKAGLIIGILLVIAIAVVAVVFSLTSSLTDTVDHFFTASAENKTEAMELHLSQAFLESTPINRLVPWMAARKLDRVEETRWTNRNISGNRGTLNGEVTTIDGSTLPIEILFVKENGEWKIFSMETLATGVTNLQTSNDDQQFALARGVMRRFVVSLTEGNMQHFYNSISGTWQEQYTVEDLDKAYAGFFNWADDLQFVHDMPPVLHDTSGLNPDGILEIQGYYPTDPKQFKFEQRFMQEEGNWKLIGLNVSIE